MSGSDGAWILVQLLGGALVAAVLQDVFFTVLFPGSGRGFLRRWVARWVWAGFRAVDRQLTPSRRRNFLTYCGPVQITVSLGTWGLVLVVGWAAIFAPALGTGITASSGSTARSWATALYYSGYVLTTLGLGDVVPRTGLYRLLTVIEAGIGFAALTMVVTYFLSVYSALTERKTSSSLLHHRTYDTGRAAVLVAGLAVNGELTGAADQLMAMASSVQRITETHAAYPVLRYFHHRRACHAIPRILLLSLDTVTVLRSVVDVERYGYVIASPALVALEAAAGELVADLTADTRAQPRDTDEQAWRESFAAAARRLQEAGLSLRADREAAADEYVGLRRRWDAPLRALTSTMLYDWADIDRPAVLS